MTNNRIRNYFHVAMSPYLLVFVALFLCVSAVNLSAQEPKPGPARTVNIPAVKETKLKNGLTVAVAEKHNVPLVTVQLLVRSGANAESMEKAGLADIAAAMLTKGTKTRTAEQIAEQIEFLGGSIYSGASWNNSSVSVSVTKDKLDQAMAILADVVLNPTFPQDELDLLKTQYIDGLTYSLTQPGFLGNYVASKYSYEEHPAGGTPQSIASITRDDVLKFFSSAFQSDRAVLIFAGDITSKEATALSEKALSTWTPPDRGAIADYRGRAFTSVKEETPLIKRMLIVDLPNSGQASVTYHKKIASIGRSSKDYYPASVMNSVLGGGYSSRLNQEIRIKRGLSYGAGSSFAWRGWKTNFGTRTQTKNESAAEVAEVLVNELNDLAIAPIEESELIPRKAVLTGGFGRNIETNGGLVNALADLYSFGISPNSLNEYMPGVNAVTDKQIRDFVTANLYGGDIIIVGDYSLFKDDLAKRFPNIKPQVIPAAELDITKPGLRK